jgi:hypothetical protein
MERNMLATHFFLLEELEKCRSLVAEDLECLGEPFKENKAKKEFYDCWLARRQTVHSYGFHAVRIARLIAKCKIGKDSQEYVARRVEQALLGFPTLDRRDVDCVCLQIREANY